MNNIFYSTRVYSKDSIRPLFDFKQSFTLGGVDITRSRFPIRKQAHATCSAV